MLKTQPDSLYQEFTQEDGLLLQPLLRDIWNFYAGKAFSPRLRYLYALRHCTDTLLRMKYGDVTVKEEDETNALSDAGKLLLAMRQDTSEEIARLEHAVSIAAGGAVAVMTATAPRMTDPTLYPDPNGAGYRGDPQRRNWEPQ